VVELFKSFIDNCELIIRKDAKGWHAWLRLPLCYISSSFYFIIDFSTMIHYQTAQKGTLLACYAASFDRREIVAIPTL
jgi:hypothetical protein